MKNLSTCKQPWGMLKNYPMSHWFRLAKEDGNNIHPQNSSSSLIHTNSLPMAVINPHQYLLFPKLHLNLLPIGEQTASHEPHPPPISFMKVTKHISAVSINVILSCALIISAKDFPRHSCDNNSVSMNFFVNSMSMNLQNVILIQCCSQ